MQKVLEKAYEAGKVSEEEVLDGVLALGRAYMWMGEYDDCEACLKRAKEGFLGLLRENNANAVEAANDIATQLLTDDEMIAECRRLWEIGGGFYVRRDVIWMRRDSTRRRKYYFSQFWTGGGGCLWRSTRRPSLRSATWGSFFLRTLRTTKGRSTTFNKRLG